MQLMLIQTLRCSFTCEVSDIHLLQSQIKSKYRKYIRYQPAEMHVVATDGFILGNCPKIHVKLANTRLHFTAVYWNIPNIVFQKRIWMMYMSCMQICKGSLRLPSVVRLCKWANTVVHTTFTPFFYLHN